MIAAITFELSKITPTALLISATGYVVVFIALVLLFYAYDSIPYLINLQIRQKLRRQGKHHQASAQELSVSGEVNAAITMAIFLYMNEFHDEESSVVTIKQVSRRYSPWSSKIYSLNNYSRNF
jgi:Na+-transporting methylmalonyl-CoA/oxaloacetate decarboxylase gamma subunit